MINCATIAMFIVQIDPQENSFNRFSDRKSSWIRSYVMKFNERKFSKVMFEYVIRIVFFSTYIINALSIRFVNIHIFLESLSQTSIENLSLNTKREKEKERVEISNVAFCYNERWIFAGKTDRFILETMLNLD